MDKENIKKLIIKFRSKLMPLIMALILTLGALLPTATADAKEIPVFSKMYNNGDSFDIGWYNSQDGQVAKYKGNIVSDSPVYSFTVCHFDNGRRGTSSILVSSSPFSVDSFYCIYAADREYKDYATYPWVNPGSYSLNCVFVSDDSSNAYFINLGGGTWSGGLESDIYTMLSGSSEPIAYCRDFNSNTSVRSEFICSVVGSNGQIGTETISSGLNSDLSNGSYNSSLGYLADLKLENYNLLEDNKYPVDTKYIVTWDNTREDFDDTYKVAHYVKVHATFQLKKDLSYTSERIWVNDALYTDCKSSFINSEALTSTSEYQSFIEEVEAVDKKTIGTYVTEYEHNLIIYKETDSGTKYGFWNVLKLDKYGEGYVGSYLIPSYGIEDSEGNYVAMESGKPLGSYTYGQGSTFEEAESNSQVINSPIDGDGSDDLFATIEQYLNNGKSFIGNFPSLMGDIFENMPPHLVTMITIGLGLLLALRLFGR